VLKLREIMTRALVTVSPDLTIREAMELFVERHVSGAPVVTGGDVVGVVSTTDLLTFAAGLPAGAPREESAIDAEPTREQVSVEGEPPATFFTELWSDDLADVTERFDASSAAAVSPLDSHTVSEAMTDLPVCAMSPGTPVDEAADYMRRSQIHRVLVMSGRRLEGIVTTTDIANAVADHKIATRTYVFGTPRGHVR
jgi:CBS domain-containing protein